ncbi:MAG: hypothetical protein NZ872_03720 [Archaeoglobaceae archaeon]|nr:hypothetical protein [Archaeoglobaceae archaeon]MDW8128308.1 hypothetical protein [Archaeoglobaceae archaeon]
MCLALLQIFHDCVSIDDDSPFFMMRFVLGAILIYTVIGVVSADCPFEKLGVI